MWNVWFNFRIWSTRNHRRVFVIYALEDLEVFLLSFLHFLASPSYPWDPCIRQMFFISFVSCLGVRQTSFGSSSCRNFGSFHWRGTFGRCLMSSVASNSVRDAVRWSAIFEVICWSQAERSTTICYPCQGPNENQRVRIQRGSVLVINLKMDPFHVLYICSHSV